jgi:hypothetical protein
LTIVSEHVKQTTWPQTYGSSFSFFAFFFFGAESSSPFCSEALAGFREDSRTADVEFDSSFEQDGQPGLLAPAG